MPEYNFTVDWFSRAAISWNGILGHLRDQPIQCLEIGSYEGRSATWLAENILTHPDSRIYCIDPWMSMENFPFDYVCAEARFDHNKSVCQNGDRIIKMRGTLATLHQDYLPDNLDFIYIDGSHEARDVMTDFVLAFPLLKPGGILIFDDYNWDEYPQHEYPKAAIDFITHAWGPLLESVEYNEWQCIVRKK